MLWLKEEPVGIAVFTSAPLSLAMRNRFFGMKGKWSRVRFQAMNRQIVMLSRVVIHPTYRGAGIAATFIRKSCESCSIPWIETLTQMGHINPFFEKAGFVRVSSKSNSNKKQRACTKNSLRSHTAIYGTPKHSVGKQHGKKTSILEETHRKSCFANPVYYIFDNRKNKT
ncbi:hypothetical protein MNBD_PLANCTO02-3035 [hydrothermal vent metagenome]|uniref:N-acetyltransferase domain-containing protein n=1 Tax=hydrothermal vent metagenome TaxID=652676 RepID=A0A3B1E8M7_9ZZZZ